MTLNEVLAKWNFDPVDHKFIFQKMEDIAIWQEIGILKGIGRELDIDYLFNHSGNKRVTPVVEFLFKKYGGYLEQTTFVNKLIDMIRVKFYNNWKRIYETLNLDYTPIDNYNVVEDENVGSKIETSNDVYGFTAKFEEDSVKADKSSVSGDFNDNKRKMTRRGNIGVATNQTMIEAELELRKKNYYEMIYRDIDSLLVLRIYD